MIKERPFFTFYINTSKFWLKQSKKAENEYCRFFFLWAAFNALYNLELDESRWENIRVEKILEKIDEKESKKILLKNKKYSDFLMIEGGPIINMKEELMRNFAKYKLDKFKDIYKEYQKNLRNYENSSYPYKNKIKDIFFTIYKVRNNLTHGSKAGVERDKKLVDNSNPIIESTVRFLINKLEDRY